LPASCGIHAPSPLEACSLFSWKGAKYRLSRPKLLVPSIATGSAFAADLKGEFYFVGSGGGGGGGYGITLLPNVRFSLLYLLGLLNSKMSTYFLRLISTPFRGGYIALNRQYIEHLPIHTVNFEDSSDVARHDKLVALVERILAQYDELSSSKEDVSAQQERQIRETDTEIDELVYRIYGLNEREIVQIEESIAE
jgi:hypothetical protein